MKILIVNLLLQALCLSLLLVSNCSAVIERDGNTVLCSKFPWSRQGGTDQQCECGDDLHGAVKCDSETMDTSVLTCHCMSYSDLFNKTLVGHCIFQCNILDYQYVRTTNSKNNSLHYIDCTRIHLHRTGQNCGKCLPGHAPAVYSYLMACVECKDYKYNWLKYIAVAFLPLTFVCFIIVLFRINVTSGKLNTYILISQLIAAPIQVRIAAINAYPGLSVVGLRTFASLYMIWNLDIFRAFYKPFCLHPNTTTLQTFALEYAVAVYPMILIFIIYVLVRLHDNYTLVIRLWRPFYKIFARIRREWDIRSSLVDAFVTFLLLSYVKIANISFDLLTPVSLYDVNGNATPSQYLYYAGTVEYFGREHIPYAILALIMLLLFNIFPLLLLCLYPTSCFQHCKDYCHIHSNAVHIFVYTLQGCYKTKPYDCRYFAGIYLGFRLINLVLFSVTTSSLYYALGGTVSLFMTVLVAIVRPYDNRTYVIVDVLFLALFTLIGFGITAFSFARFFDPIYVDKKWYTYCFFILLIPPVYGTGLLVYQIVPKKVLHKLKELGKQCCKCQNHSNYEQLRDPVPYRLEHSDEYPPLLNTPGPQDHVINCLVDGQ